MTSRKPTHWQEGQNWRQLLDSHDFGEWEDALAKTMGHHRSRMRSASASFRAHMRVAQLDEFKVLWLEGTGELELVREQCGSGVIWLPTQGLIQETINGEEHLAEPGNGLIFQPGDEMTGLTTYATSGVSILVPEHNLRVKTQRSRTLRKGIEAQRLLKAAWGVVAAAAMEPAGGSFAAEEMVDALREHFEPAAAGHRGERVTAIRRRALVADACVWMQERLADRFSVVELAEAMSVSVRTVQNSFQAELGCSPLTELKRRRLHHLRMLLLEPELHRHSVADLMSQAGLLACGVTSADYQRWCGELPSQTRINA